ncbi:MAG: GGDEF domain-containing response regulator [Verrucomicrobiota bacterium]
MRTILMIDDDRLQCRLTEKLFEKFRGERFRLYSVFTYEEGLAELMEGRHAACLLDYQLGPRDGLMLMRTALAAGATTPIIFLTAETSRAVDTEALNAGAFDYLVKGEITVGALERSLRYALKLGETLAELRRLATHDALTGLHNRREFDRRLVEEVARARRFGRPLSLVLLDLDRFKSINDTHGHPAGDAVLVEVARRLSADVRRTDRLARHGGEEFALLLVETAQDAALAQARRLLTLIAEAPVVLPDGGTLTVTASAGVAGLTADGDELSLVRAADEALYRAKAAGRGRALPA